MGADYTAKAIIGVRLPEDESLPKLMQSVRKRAFDHKFEDDGETEYHPKDGRKLWLDETVEIETEEPAIVFSVDDDLDEDDIYEGQKLIKAPEGLEFANGTDGDNLCIGVVIRTGSSNGEEDIAFERIPDIDKVKTQLKTLLEPVGLWVEKDFGLYAILSCSY